MKVLSVVGARPQFIKLAPLSQEIQKYHQAIIVHTGQHFDEEMSKLFFQDLNITEPDYNLEISGGTHGEQTGKMIIEIEKVLMNEKPAVVIVFGDTNSTLAGSLASSKLNIPTIHIEAGLRSFNRTMPEEINRIVADHTSDFLFAPTDTAIKNLYNEGLKEKSFLTGDIMVDSLNMAYKLAKKKVTEFNQYSNYYLLTLHRPYNVDNPTNLERILTNLGLLDKQILFPVHPRTRNIIKQYRITLSDNFKLLKPLGYIEFINLQFNAKKIITDSGGIQKEAYILKKPCITLRSETEWIETVESGWNLLLNPDSGEKMLQKIEEFEPPLSHPLLFGEKVSKKMVGVINEKIRYSN